MRSYSLKIADYIINFSAGGKGPELVPSAAQASFLCKHGYYDLKLEVSYGNTSVRPTARQVFRAPYVEEINGVQVKSSDKFWTVYTDGDDIVITSTLPLLDAGSEALITVRPGADRWNIIFNTATDSVNPFVYPVDGLILYYLTAINSDIFIHGSGVEINGRGFIFSGQSGKGKSTMARLFKERGGNIIHDDRLIIRERDNAFIMYNTPVYEDEVSSRARIEKLYLIDHGRENMESGMGGSESVAEIMSNCIQHNWSSKLIGNLTGAILRLVTAVKVRKLLFYPTKEIVDFILNDERA